MGIVAYTVITLKDILFALLGVNILLFMLIYRLTNCFLLLICKLFVGVMKLLRRLIFGFVCVCSFLMMMSACMAANNNAEWYWISSDDKYSKFFAPAKVQVTKSFGRMAVQISAWTKTNYSFAGAKETLENYGLTDIKPGDLSYSVAEVEVNPQNRTLAYVNETFFNKADEKVWEKTYSPLRPKEMNSQEFDEDFYCFIVDTIFGLGENERRQADDRWLSLWQESNRDGGVTYAMADTTTMRLKGENMIFWEWQEIKNASDAVTKIVFQKKAVNIPQYTEKVIRVLNWTPDNGWKDITDTTDGMYSAIAKESNSEKTLKVLRVYEGDHESWVKRYSLDTNK